MKEKTASYIKNEPCVDTNSTCPGGTLSTVSQSYFLITPIIKQMIGKVRNFLVDWPAIEISFIRFIRFMVRLVLKLREYVELFLKMVL